MFLTILIFSNYHAAPVLSQNAWDPDLTMTVDAVIPYEGQYAHGTAYVYLGAGHTSIVDPVIVVEGFDFDNSTGAQELYGLLSSEGLLADLRAEGYDAIVLDFAEGDAYIQKNAMLLVELIQTVRNRIPAHLDMVVIGASMGGLVSRYALAYMETEGIDHRVRTFISFDSPQQGACIPEGVLWFLNFWKSESEKAEEYWGALNSNAARQMLRRPYVADRVIDRTDRWGLEDDLYDVGNWPQNLRKVAIANGSGYGQDQGFAPGDQLIRYDWRTSGCIYRDAYVRGNVWAMNGSGSNHIIFDGDQQTPPGDDWRACIDAFDWTERHDNDYAEPDQDGIWPAVWENAPGGYRGTMAQVDASDVPVGDIIAYHDNHAFIPTVSALALDTGYPENPFFDIAGADGAGALLGMTPFDAVYYPVENQPHVSINAQNKVWFLNEIRRSVTNVPFGPLAVGAELRSVFPNPFNPLTRVAFHLPDDGRARLDVFDIGGRFVTTLEDGVFAAGDHVTPWNGKDASGRPVGSGSYFVRLTVGDRVDTRGLTLVK